MILTICTLYNVHVSPTCKKWTYGEIVCWGIGNQWACLTLSLLTCIILVLNHLTHTLSLSLPFDTKHTGLTCMFKFTHNKIINIRSMPFLVYPIDAFPWRLSLYIVSILDGSSEYDKDAQRETVNLTPSRHLAGSNCTMYTPAHSLKNILLTQWLKIKWFHMLSIKQEMAMTFPNKL